MPGEPLIILASARKDSDTKKFLNKAFPENKIKLIDLLDFHISQYSYENNYPNTDQFFVVMDELLKYKVIVFATPVYWYAMSGLMKIFIDRFTDLVTIQKQLGRHLHGKSTFLFAVGAEEELPTGFDVPFKLTSDYFNMNYQHCIYYSTKFPKTDHQLKGMIIKFREQVRGCL